MLLERAEITVREGLEAEFDLVFRQQGMAILTAVPGVRWVRFGRGVENPGKFLILAEWDSMESHAQFRDLPVYPEFGKLFAAYSTGGTMEHFEIA